MSVGDRGMKRGSASLAGIMIHIAAASVVVLSTAAQSAAPTAPLMRKTAAVYYGCQVAAKPVEASAFVLERSTGRNGYKAMALAMDPACLKGDAFKYVETLRGNLDLIRYGAATALVMREYGATFPALLAAAPALKHEPRPFDETAFRQSPRFRNLGPKALTQAKQEKAVFDFLETFGDCVVRRNPSNAHRFLTTQIGSKDESLALAGVRPSLAACLPPGRQANLDLDLVRGTMADNFYRLAKAAPKSAGAKAS
ncbi:MAG: hypothetical protein LH465_03750 [Sphingomonas bacterium]|nr:hypothetical protein [Sphingomonas bacterium]